MVPAYKVNYAPIKNAEAFYLKVLGFPNEGNNLYNIFTLIRNNGYILSMYEGNVCFYGIVNNKKLLRSPLRVYYRERLF